MKIVLNMKANDYRIAIERYLLLNPHVCIKAAGSLKLFSYINVFYILSYIKYGDIISGTSISAYHTRLDAR